MANKWPPLLPCPRARPQWLFPVDGSDFRVPLDTYFLPQAALLISSKLLSGHSFPSSSSAIKLGGKRQADGNTYTRHERKKNKPEI